MSLKHGLEAGDLGTSELEICDDLYAIVHYYRKPRGGLGLSDGYAEYCRLPPRR